MKIYCVQMINDDIGEVVMGYATTEDKAKKMIEVIQKTDGFEDYEYEYYYVHVDMLIINNKMIEF